MYRLLALFLGIVLTLMFISLSSEASADILRWQELESAGYPLTVEGLRSALKKGDTNIVGMALGCAVEKGYHELVPDIRKFESALDLKDVEQRNASLWYTTTKCLFALDAGMSAQELSQRVEIIRRQALQGKGDVVAYTLLIAANKYKGINIRDDLFLLAHPGRLMASPKSEVFSDLFKLYGSEINADDIAELKKAWETAPSSNPEELQESQIVNMAFQLLEKGYMPTHKGLKEIIDNNDRETMPLCLEYANRSALNVYFSVRKYEKSLNLDVPDDLHMWLATTKFFFSGYITIEDSEVQSRLTVLRKLLYSGKGDKDAYEAFIAVHNRFRERTKSNVKVDLLKLAHPGEPLSDMKERIITDLFQYYHDTLTESECADLKTWWDGNDKMQELIAKLKSPSTGNSGKPVATAVAKLPSNEPSKPATLTPASPRRNSPARENERRSILVKKYAAGALATIVVVMTFVIVSRLRRRHPEEK